MAVPFRFKTSLHLTLLTGRRARDLAELLGHLQRVSGAAIFHHTHRFLAQHQYLSPEPPNDFAYWVRTVLREDRLGEQLAAIDVVAFASIRALREAIIATIERHLAGDKDLRVAPEGEEFHFREAVTFVLPTAHVARDLREFAAGVEQVGLGSLSHHMFEAGLRLERGRNDFSRWLGEELGEREAADAIARLDPYTYTLDGLRREIVRLVRARIESTV